METKKHNESWLFSLFAIIFSITTGYYGYIEFSDNNFTIGSILILNSIAMFFSLIYSIAKLKIVGNEYTEEIKDANKYDYLTKLPNVFEFRRLVKSKIDLEKEEDTPFRAYYITISLEKIKTITEIYGYNFADDIIKVISEEIVNQLDDDDIIGKLQGDEFGILTFQKEEDILKYIKRLSNVFSQPHSPKNKNGEVYIPAKMGIAAWDKKYKDEFDEIVKKSIIALDTAKKTGNSIYKVYNKTIEKEKSEILELENDLRNAIKNEEIEVFFQPKVDCNGKVKSAEALARWFSKKRNSFIRPDIFIEIAEDIGMIEELGMYIMEYSIKELKKWHNEGYDDLVVAVNVSTKQFTSDLPNKISNLISKYNINPKHLEVEVTESALVNDKKTSIELLEKIKNTGVSLAIDDFGTGYSSLSYLVDFPLDVVKIDKSFCDKLREKEPDLILKGEAVISTVIHLSHKLNCKVVAEGVEDINQFNFLKKEKCDLIQGYYFSKPLNKDDFILYIKQKNE
jgi:diguanylate cyclase (GGDEF)-like protein